MFRENVNFVWIILRLFSVFCWSQVSITNTMTDYRYKLWTILMLVCILNIYSWKYRSKILYGILHNANLMLMYAIFFRSRIIFLNATIAVQAIMFMLLRNVLLHVTIAVQSLMFMLLRNVLLHVTIAVQAIMFMLLRNVLKTTRVDLTITHINMLRSKLKISSKCKATNFQRWKFRLLPLIACF